MSTIWSNKIGLPFSKQVIDELNTRVGGTGNKDYLRNAYFVLTRVQDLPKDGETNPNELTGTYAKLNKNGSSPSPYYTGEGNRPPTIKSVDIDVKDYAFYEVQVSFEMSNLETFNAFRKMWLDFGVPVKLELGIRGNGVKNDTDGDDPNYLKLYGAVVKFDYNYSKESGTNAYGIISGTMVIYSISAIMVTESLDSNMENEMNTFRRELKAHLTKIGKSGSKKEYYCAISAGAGSTGRPADSNTEYDPVSAESQNIDQITDINFFREKLQDKRNLYKIVLSNLSLNSDIFGTNDYFYVSLSSINSYINNFLTNRTKKDYIIDITNPELVYPTGAEYISNVLESVLINPWREITPTLGNVYISAKTIYEISLESNGIFDFLEKIISLVNFASYDLVKFQKIQTDSKGYGAGNQLTYFDSKNIDFSGTYFTFDIFKPYSIFDNISINTEISPEIATYTFHRMNSRILNDRTVHLNKTDKEPSIVLKSLGGLNISSADTTDTIKMSEFIKSNIEAIEDIVNTNNSGNVDRKKYVLSGLYSYVKNVVPLVLELSMFEKMKKGDEAIKIPLKISFTMSGIAGIKIGQIFKLKHNNFFPISTSLDNTECHYMVSTIKHSLQYENTYTTWKTTVGGIMYLESSVTSENITKAISDEVQKSFDYLLNTYSEALALSE